MNVLVTGGSGMLGKVLTQTLASQGKVLGVSRSGASETAVCDLTNLRQVERLFGSHHFDLVVHTAAYSDVDGCERNPEFAHQSNAVATKYLAQSCGQHHTPFIYVSTDYVFDGAKKALYEEEDTPCPINIYGMTKLEGEYHTRRWAALSAIVRTSWLFGPGNPSNFVNAIAERLRKEKVVRVLADQEDRPTYVKDLSEAIRTIAGYLLSLSKKGPAGSYQGIFHVCNAGEATRFEMTSRIREYLGLQSVTVEKLDKLPSETRPALRPQYASMSTKHYEAFFKTKLRHWEESLKEYLLGQN